MKLLSLFPREIAFPQRVLCNTKEEFYRLFNLYNGVKQRLYFSLYNSNKDIDLIAFDLDNENSLSNLKRLHYYLNEKNLKHLMTFSTRGFWLYIFTKNFEYLSNKKSALKNAQLYILKQANIEVKEVDQHILGDINRISRLLFSFDVKRGLYCVPVDEEDLRFNYDYIKNKALKQQYSVKYYGNGLLDISLFDKECECTIEVPKLDYDTKLIIEKDTFLKTIPECFAQILLRKDVHWRERYFIILYFKEIGILKSESYKIMQQFLSPEKFKEDIIKERQIEYIYARNDVMPTQELLIKEGICGLWCSTQKHNKVYK